MTKVLKTITMIATIAIIFTVVGNNTRFAKVVESYDTPNATVLITEDGNIWETTRLEKTGNKMIIEFDTKGTKDITDDVIMEVYEG